MSTVKRIVVKPALQPSSYKLMVVDGNIDTYIRNIVAVQKRKKLRARLRTLTAIPLITTVVWVLYVILLRPYTETVIY